MTSFRSGPVTVEVPATSANLGPGYDCFGLALDLVDTLTAEVVDGPLVVEVEGEGADAVARDESHLVVRAMAAGLSALGADLPGVRLPGIRLHCHNVIPHARGLGSSSAAIVGGIALARALVADRTLDEGAALDLATRLEGHPDNVAPAQLGGFTVASLDAGRVTVARLDVAAGMAGVAYVPPTAVETALARGLLPASVPHADAADNTARAALLVAALTGRPDLLLPATVDRLHQAYRRPAMPDSLDLVEALRADGHAAVVSGAGPTVLVLTAAEAVADLRERTPTGWESHPLALGGPGVRLRPTG